MDEFITTFISFTPKVVLHDFIAKQQANFLQEAKRNLKMGEFLVVGDFAENYSFVVQDAAQSFHWNNLQATLHPFVCYYRDESDHVNDDDGVMRLKHRSLVIISESNNHDTVAVHLFQKVLMRFLTDEIRTPTKIIYFSDGCAAQYKNRKNFSNICHHDQDFGMPAEWHFFATSHGKGPCDGVGGTVKRLAAKASLQRPFDKQIMTPHQLFEFAVSEIPSVKFHYATNNEYLEQASYLKNRFETTRTIAGTHRLHSFIPILSEIIEVRDFSGCPDKRQERVTIAESSTVSFSAINGYVTVIYDGFWWLASVIKSMQETEEVEVNFLHPHGPSRSFSYPYPPDLLCVSYHDILTTSVNPTTATGRTYTFAQREMEDATKAAADH